MEGDERRNRKKFVISLWKKRNEKNTKNRNEKGWKFHYNALSDYEKISF